MKKLNLFLELLIKYIQNFLHKNKTHTKYRNVAMNDFDQISAKLAELEEKWLNIKDGFKNPKQIENKFKSLENILKRANNLNDPNIIIYQINANTEYKVLEAYLKQNEISYNDHSIGAPASDKIKLFIENADTFSDEEYWRELASAYVLQNYKKIPYKTYYKIFTSERAFREKLMSEEEKQFLAQLPETLTIYRGGSLAEHKSKKYGISWSLDKKIAEQFADTKAIRDKKEMMVIEKQINKADVIAYFKERQEEEIIYIHI